MISDGHMALENDLIGTNRREEEALDEGLEDTFPASDPPSIIQPQRQPKDRDRRMERSSGGRNQVEK
jgi:hypothetical protein